MRIFEQPVSATERACVVDRALWVDVLRVIACVMVILVHAASKDVFGATDRSQALWGNLYGSLARPGVPLFLFISGMLLLPVKVDTLSFLARRLRRIVPPLIVWSVLYSIPGNTDSPRRLVRTIGSAIFVFPEGGMHLWYLYVLIGLYLFAPIISKWLVGASQREEIGFAVLWAMTSLFPLVRKVFPRFWGEAAWNDFGMLHYFAGPMGYLLLGYWARKYAIFERRRAPTVAVASFVAAYGLTFFGQWFFIVRKHTVSYLPWDFFSPNVAIMTIAIATLVRRLQPKPDWLRSLVVELSTKSFGIFLVHYFLVYLVGSHCTAMGLRASMAIPINTLVTFGISYVVVKVISCLPRSELIIG